MSGADSKSRPRAWRLQFSLRLLLVAFTAFAIGFPIWYRWPYKETIEKRDPATGKLWSTRIITWQRQWGGGRLAHGPEQTILGDGDITITKNNVQGKRHGPYTVRDAKGRMREDGQYVDGLKEGRWVAENQSTMWHHGMLDGECEFPAASGRGEKNLATFKAGRLVSFNGKPVQDTTFDLTKIRKVDERVSAELSHETLFDFVEQPLKDAMMYIGDLHKIPSALDTKGGFDLNLPITGTYRGLELQSALVLMLAPHGLACDYRYGVLCVTTAESAKNWRDKTGVEDIRPPAGSSLARAWDEPTGTAFTNGILADTLVAIARPLAIDIDTTQIGP